MNRPIKAVFFDPSHKNLGIAKALIDPKTYAISIIDLKLIETEKENSKRIRVSSDDFRRAVELAEAMHEAEEWADIVMAEIPSGSQSARSSLGAGVCIGLLASLKKTPIQVSPTEAKKCAVGRGTATKDEMMDWAHKLFPNLNWIKDSRSKRPDKLIGQNEHLADAIAIGHAGVKTPEFKTAAAIISRLDNG